MSNEVQRNPLFINLTEVFPKYSIFGFGSTVIGVDTVDAGINMSAVRKMEDPKILEQTAWEGSKFQDFVGTVLVDEHYNKICVQEKKGVIQQRINEATLAHS